MSPRFREPPTALAYSRVLRQRADEVGADLLHAYGTWGCRARLLLGTSRWPVHRWDQTMRMKSTTP